MNITFFKYNVLTYRRDQFWFPLALWGLFFIIILIVGSADQNLDIVRAYLATVPLVGGIMSAYAILDDPVLELRFATPIRMAQLMGQSVLVTLLVQALCAVSFILFARVALHVDFSSLGDWTAVMLAWLIPTITLIGLGTFAALLGANAMAGSFLVGITWLMEVIIRDGMAINNWKYLYFFMGILNPEHPDLVANQLTLVATTLTFLLLGWIFLHRQERYI